MSKDPWFKDWAETRPRDVEAHVRRGRAALTQAHQDFPALSSAAEYFGGLGLQTDVIRELWPIDRHVVREIHPDAVSYLRQVVPAQVDVELADAFQDAPVSAELQVLDFGDLTATRLRWPQYEGLLRHVTQDPETQALIVTDIAGRLLHLHLDHYAKVIGEFGTTYPEYMRAWGRTFGEVTGFYPRYTALSRWSSVTYLARGEAPHRLEEVL